MKRKIYSRAFIFIFFSTIFIMGVTYVLLRWLFTLNIYTSPFVTFWSYTLCIAEILVLIVFTNFAIILLKANSIEKIEPNPILQNDYMADYYKDGVLLTFKNYCPSVDIFICTLNESADMLSTTIAACVNIDYPNHKVYVLDDGNRDEIKKLTEALGANYITRTTNKGFKAGNINNALSQTNGQIVVIFDADHIPASTFLKETVYYFSEDQVALVQTPQHFCNPDAFQKNFQSIAELVNEQDLFYRIIEPSLGDFDSVFCGGTNILLRRKHLNNVGNFPENTITEDSLLGLILHSSGYKVVYYNRPLAIGLAASSFEEYIKQRRRWAKGNVQIVTNPDNWKYYARLSFMQKFLYLSGILYFFTPLARLIFLAAPVMFLFFDISPVLILFYQIFAFQFCYFTLKFAFIFTSKIKPNTIIFADVYDLIISLFTIGSILHALLLPGKLAKIKFSVTKKELSGEKTDIKYKIPLVLILFILLAAEAQGVYDIVYSEPYSYLAIVANLFWNSINIVVLIFGLAVVSDKPEKRFYQRVKIDAQTFLKEGLKKSMVQIEDISRSGARFTADEDFSGEDPCLGIEGECDPMEVIKCDVELDSQEGEKKYHCTSRFKEPMSLSRIAKLYILRLNRFVRFTYKKPDKWDEYYDDK